MKIDFHTHAFEDALAAKAMAILESKSELKAPLDGRVSSLLQDLKGAGFDHAVVCPIATRPTHWDGIRRWAHSIEEAHPELTVLGSVHPADEGILEHIDQLAAEGFKGVKFHPYYQEFAVDEARMFPIYERLAAHNMFGVFHTGFDVGFPLDRIGDPVRVKHVLEDLPSFRFIATHMGGWMLWNEVREHLLGRDIFIETSFSLEHLPPQDARAMFLAHPAERWLFGTDSPWQTLSAELAYWDALDLPAGLLEKAFGQNAARLLRLSA